MALIQLMTSICSKPNVFWEASNIRPELLCSATVFGEEDGDIAAKPPAFVPASLPVPCPRVQGAKQVSFWFHTFFLQLQGKLEDAEGKEGVLCGSSIK